jgi:hypothetical protein
MLIHAVIQHTSQLWPTVTRVLTAVATAGIGLILRTVLENHRTNMRIEVAVNGKFAEKVAQLEVATQKLEQMTALRDQAIATTDTIIHNQQETS